jgi:hypothetical protein
MDRFDGYRWQDHAVRPGWWKLDLVLAAVSICVISATFEPDVGADLATTALESPQTPRCKADKERVVADRSCEDPEIAREWMPSSHMRHVAPAGPSS